MARPSPRVGALPSLLITGTMATSTMKGKEQRWTIPKDVRRSIERAGLSLRRPLADLSQREGMAQIMWRSIYDR
jgi:hypothetical protein